MRTACLILLCAAARADIVDDVKHETAPVAQKRESEARVADKDAQSKQKRVLGELEKAEKRAREAEKRMSQIAADAEKARAEAEAQAKKLDEAREASLKARASVDAARALEAAALKVQKGDAHVEAELKKAAGDPALKKAAQAIEGAAAYLKGDSTRALSLLNAEVLEAMPSAQRWVGLARLQQGDQDGAFAA